MLYLTPFTSSISNAAALQQVTAFADGIVQTRDNAVVMPHGFNHLLGGFFFGTNLTRAQFQPPSIRRYGFYDVRPIQNVAVPAGAQPGFVAMFDPSVPNMLDLEDGEELPAYATQGSAGAQQAFAAALLTTEKPSPIQAKILTVRATSATTLVANTFTTCVLTFDTPLPQGKFHCVGMRVESATGVFFRAIHQEGVWRPGGICVSAVTAFEPAWQRRGGWGRWFDFDYLTPPGIEIMSTAADTAETFWLDVVPV